MFIVKDVLFSATIESVILIVFVYKMLFLI